MDEAMRVRRMRYAVGMRDILECTRIGCRCGGAEEEEEEEEEGEEEEEVVVVVVVVMWN
jgi:hypothetical protein